MSYSSVFSGGEGTGSPGPYGCGSIAEGTSDELQCASSSYWHL